MGVCLPRAGRRLQVTRQTSTPSRGMAGTAAVKPTPCWQTAEILGPLRHAGECVGVVQGHLGDDYTGQSREGVSGFSVGPPRDPRRLVVRWLTARGAASRDGYEPPSLYCDLGFRCAEFRQGVVSEAER